MSCVLSLHTRISTSELSVLWSPEWFSAVDTALRPLQCEWITSKNTLQLSQTSLTLNDKVATKRAMNALISALSVIDRLA
jgi:hypothetical protein